MSEKELIMAGRELWLDAVTSLGLGPEQIGSVGLAETVELQQKLDPCAANRLADYVTGTRSYFDATFDMATHADEHAEFAAALKEHGIILQDEPEVPQRQSYVSTERNLRVTSETFEIGNEQTSATLVSYRGERPFKQS